LIIDNDGANAGYGVLEGIIYLDFAHAIQDGATLELNDGGRVYGYATDAISGGTFTVNSGGKIEGFTPGLITGGRFTLEGGGIGVGEVALYGTNTLDELSGYGRIGNGETLQLNQATDTAWSGQITGGGTFVKQGSGTFTLNRTGTGDAVQQSVRVQSGTLALGASDQISDSAPLELSGGTFATGGNSETVGALKLSGNSTIELDHSVHTLTFADSSAETWTGTLAIEGWVGDETGGNQGRIYVESQGLTATQRSQIQWAGGALVGADFVSGTNELRPNLDASSGSGTTLVMQVVSDGGITLVAPQHLPLPSQTIQSDGNAAYVNSISDTMPISVQDVRGTSSPLTVQASVTPLAHDGVTRSTTVSVESTSGDNAGITHASVTGTGNLLECPATVNRQFSADLRVTAGGLSGADARAGTYTGSVVLTVN
jgi:hypothetical protein